MGKIDWDIITNYTDTVTTALKTVTFPKVQEQVYLRNQGNANFTYTIGSQSGTLTPGQSVTVNQDVSSYTVQAVSGTHTFELRAKEKGTEKTEESSDITADLDSRGVNFLKYNPVGNGVANDTAALQNAINANQVVFLGSNKTYLIDTITLPNRPTFLIGVNVAINTTTSSGFVFVKGGTASTFATNGVEFNNGITHRLTDCTITEIQEVFGNLEVNNTVTSDTGSLNVANLSGQSLGTSAPIGFIFHHYTDGKCMQIDNVGTGTILTLNNARNILRRSDQDSNYTGNGSYIDLRKSTMNAGVETNSSIFRVDNNCVMLWEKNTASLTVNKADDGLWGASINVNTKHNNLLFLKNGSLENIQLVRGTDSALELRLNTEIKFRTVFTKGIGEFKTTKADDGLYGFSYTLDNKHANAFAVINGGAVELLVGNGTVDIGNMMNLKTVATPPTARKGSIYFDGTNFKACKDGTTWQTVNLT